MKMMLRKGRVYVQPGDNVPKGVHIETGERGAHYYDSQGREAAVKPYASVFPESSFRVKFGPGTTRFFETGEYSDTLESGKATPIFHATADQEQAIKTALTFVPDEIKQRLRDVSFRMTTTQELDSLFPVDKELGDTSVIEGLADYTNRQILLNSDRFAPVGNPDFVGRKMTFYKAIFHEIGHFVEVDNDIPVNLLYTETKHTSKYGALNSEEAWAEAFANAIVNPSTTLGPRTEQALRLAGFKR